MCHLDPRVKPSPPTRLRPREASRHPPPSPSSDCRETCALESRIGDDLPEMRSHPIGLGRHQTIGHHDPFDHVGQHGGGWPTGEADRHHDVIGSAAAHRAVDPDQPGWTAKARRHEVEGTCGIGEGAGGVGELDGGERFHDADHHDEGVCQAFPVTDLNPAQQRVIALLGKSPGGERADLPEGWADDLRAELEQAFADAAEAIPPERPLFVSKHALAGVHQCEAHHLAGDGAFEWSPPTARGTVTHKAIELGIHVVGQPVPADLVDEAIARLMDSTAPVARYLGALGQYDRAELRSLAVNHVSRFFDCFPPLKAAWIPRTESRVGLDFASGRIRLSGKVDLTLGRPHDKVIIDLKTGWPAPVHREDLRFYALLETLTIGAPPRKVASYYLDAAEAHPEDVTEGTLLAAARRTAAGILRLVELHYEQAEPERRAGPSCRWCPLSPDCEPGGQYLAESHVD